MARPEVPPARGRPHPAHRELDLEERRDPRLATGGSSPARLGLARPSPAQLGPPSRPNLPPKNCLLSRDLLPTASRPSP